MTNLLLFTIGPVQNFIAQARKTQDLYAGSRLLSELIKIAMQELQSRYSSVEFIFPRFEENSNNKKSYPNRFIASIPEADQDNLKNLGKDLKERVIAEFKNKFYFNALPNAQIEDNNIGKYCKQLDNFLDINWVILPYEESEYKSEYKTKYKEIEQTLGAVKNVRSFDQLDELGRKCSLCGERNVLFCQKGFKYKQLLNDKNCDPENDKEIIEKIDQYNKSLTEVAGFKIETGEGLCAVCFTKRFYTPCHPEPSSCHPEQSEGSKTTDSSTTSQNDNSFPSTAGIALMDTLKKLDDKALLEECQNLFGSDWDDQCYYEENITDSYFNKYMPEIRPQQRTIIRKKQKEIAEKAKDKGLKLNKYYAIVMLDGDSTGKWLSGEYLQDTSNLKSFHEKLSEKLGSYAGGIKTHINEENGSGKLVYAGGDDVLAFVNINHLTNVLKALRDNFPKFGGTKESSASCGVAIAHYKIPLGEVLKRTREMEKAAKENGGRNAFGIAVLKHSGEIEETVFKWNFDLPEKCNRYKDCNGVNTVCLLGELIGYLKQEEFSNTFIKSLNIEFRKLMDNEGKIDNDHKKAIIETELKRLLIRSRDEKKGITKEIAIELAGKIFSLYDSKSDDVQNFLSFLNIADFLHREVNK